MKKILLILVLVTALFIFVACDSAISNTKVRVVGLSYSGSETTLAATLSNNSVRLLSNKLLADEVDEYIFPGDILTFSVEIEDPNYEFISLLSIKFNDQVIRANVDNSIVTTRDCGANICVDFPFEISADKNEYTVQEVKFAKLNTDAGVSAIIDRNSQNSKMIDVYTDELAPYVVSSVEKINQLLDNNTYYTEEYLNNDITMFELSPIIYFGSSNTLTILDIEDSPSFTEDVKISGWWGFSLPPQFTRTFPEGSFGIGNGILIISEPSGAMGWIDGQKKEISFPHPSLHIVLTYDGFSDARAFHTGNDIYIKIAGVDHLIITLARKARIVDFVYTVNAS